jgi:hypothetical protein
VAVTSSHPRRCLLSWRIAKKSPQAGAGGQTSKDTEDSHLA